MSSKRKFADYREDESGSRPGGPRQRAPGSGPRLGRDRNARAAKARPDNLGWVKKRARNIERSFKRGGDLPANVQIDMERELAHYRQRIRDVEDDKHRKKMISQYHMVRFFERKKADRLAKQIQTQLDKATDEKEIEQLKSDLHIARVDGLYARYFPFRERYVSLYPVKAKGAAAGADEKSEDSSSAAQALRSPRPPLWSTVEKLSKKGPKSLEELRDRVGDSGVRKAKEGKQSDAPANHQLGESSSDFKTKNAKSDSKKLAGPASSRGFDSSRSNKAEQTRGNRFEKAKGGRRNQRVDETPAPTEMQDDDSDGGFFEED